MDNLSFVLQPTDDPKPNTIWSDLEEAVSAQIKKDGIKQSEILPNETEEAVFNSAVANVYTDVAEFYNWYFEPDDDRNEFLSDQNQVKPDPELEKALAPVVEANLVNMREADEIPAGLDSAGLPAIMTENLARYIQNWQDWYYNRKEAESLADYYNDREDYAAIYVDSDYGDNSNITNDALDVNPDDYSEEDYNEW